MKTHVFLIYVMWIVLACDSSKKDSSKPSTNTDEHNSSDGPVKTKRSSYTIVDLDSLPELKKQALMDSFFVDNKSMPLHSDSAGRSVSVTEAQGFVKLYKNLISKRFLKELPGSSDSLVSIPLQKIIHECPDCIQNFPSYTVDVNVLHKLVVRNRLLYPAIKYLRLYPAIRKEDDKRRFTLVLVGLDKNENFVLKKKAHLGSENFILEYINPCNPRCPNVGEQ